MALGFVCASRSVERIRAADPANMLDRIKDLGKQVRDAWAIARAATLPPAYGDVRNVTLAGMGGGPGTPDMAPFQQTAGLKRPWLTRVASLPPTEPHFMNTMEQRIPLQRATSPDPYQGDPEIGAGDAGVPAEWGF